MAWVWHSRFLSPSASSQVWTLQTPVGPLRLRLLVARVPKGRSFTRYIHSRGFLAPLHPPEQVGKIWVLQDLRP